MVSGSSKHIVSLTSCNEYKTVELNDDVTVELVCTARVTSCCGSAGKKNHPAVHSDGHSVRFITDKSDGTTRVAVGYGNEVITFRW